MRWKAPPATTAGTRFSSSHRSWGASRKRVEAIAIAPAPPPPPVPFTPPSGKLFHERATGSGEWHMALKTSEKVPHATLRSQLVSKVLHQIFGGELRGGDRLVEEELAKNFGVSRTPIREALGELAAIGVISLRPN